MEAGEYRATPQASSSSTRPLLQTPQHQAYNGGVEPCTICLQHITERAIAVPCNHHTFDFICLASWLNERPICPLCNELVTKVEYDWRAPDEHKTYNVKPITHDAKLHAGQRPARYALRRDARGRSANVRSRLRLPPIEDEAVLRRRYVYRRHLYSLHVGSNRLSRYREITPQIFAGDSGLQSRARRWIRRELQVFRYLYPANGTDTQAQVRRGGRREDRNAEYLLDYIIAILKSVEIKDGENKAEDMLAEFLGRRDTQIFLHELGAWLRSPYERLEGWDRHVQYAEALHADVPGANRRKQW